MIPLRVLLYGLKPYDNLYAGLAAVCTNSASTLETDKPVVTRQFDVTGTLSTLLS